MPELPKIAQRRLEMALAGGQNLSGGPHPDADLLTGFVERNLAAPEREKVMEHLATCGECREVVALSVSQPEHGEEIGSLGRPAAAWMRWKMWRFGMGTAVAALLVGAFLFIRMEIGPEERQVATVTPVNEAEPANQKKATNNVAEVDKVSRTPSAAAQQPSGATNEHKARVDAAKRAEPSNLAVLEEKNAGVRKDQAGAANKFEEGAAKTQTAAAQGTRGENAYATAPTMNRNRGSVDQIALAGQQVRADDRAKQPIGSNETTAQGTTVNGALSGDALSASASKRSRVAASSDAIGTGTANPVKTMSKVQANAPASALTAGVSGGSQQTAADAIPPQSADSGRRQSELKAQPGVPLSSKQVPPEEVRVAQDAAVSGRTTSQLRQPASQSSAGQSPTSQSRWKVLNGKLQTSSGSGALHSPWKDVRVANGVKLRTLFVRNSPLGSSIWVGGDAGALYHSENQGTSWTQVKGNWTGDIVSLRFNSLQEGELGTSTQEKWTTADAGATWRKLPR